jgi:hypothetical protein
VASKIPEIEISDADHEKKSKKVKKKHCQIICIQENETPIKNVVFDNNE